MVMTLFRVLITLPIRRGSHEPMDPQPSPPTGPMKELSDRATAPGLKRESHWKPETLSPKA